MFLSITIYIKKPSRDQGQFKGLLGIVSALIMKTSQKEVDHDFLLYDKARYYNYLIINGHIMTKLEMLRPFLHLTIYLIINVHIIRRRHGKGMQHI